MKRRAAGFTLLEVLIALAIVAIGLLALGQSSARQLDHLTEMQARTLAVWVADNVITQTRLDRSALRAGRFQGSQEMGAQEWYWDLLIQPSPDPAVFRLDVVVHSASDRHSAVVQHTGFAAAP
jgi:general secretion pathway protein I